MPLEGFKDGDRVVVTCPTLHCIGCTGRIGTVAQHSWVPRDRAAYTIRYDGLVIVFDDYERYCTDPKGVRFIDTHV